MTLSHVLIGIASFLLIVGLYDVIQKKHAIWHNYPIIGHLRFILEHFGPELRQYFFESNRAGLPFNRSQRMYVYASAKKENNNESFGSDKDFNDPGHFFIKNALFPVKIQEKDKTIHKIIGIRRKKPYQPKSLVNISGMSFGALSGVAVEAMNKGALLADCYHTTGEGGLSPYHCNGADVVFQFGTGYSGCRDDAKGGVSILKLMSLVNENSFIKMIEIKLHQGAKPGAWSILPKVKLTNEIRKVRGLNDVEDSISPGYHTAFSNSKELVDLIEKIADATGLPVGIKCGVGNTNQWEELAEIMATTNTGPDYIIIDGGEGGTGSAKGSFVDHVGLPFVDAFTTVYKIFLNHNIQNNIVWIGSGKLGFPAQVVKAMALGCDYINIAREAMLSIGCIQAQRCHTDKCPSGVATQTAWRQRGLDPTLKSVRFANYVKQLCHDVYDITASAGYHHPTQFTTKDISINSGEARPLISLYDVYQYIPKRINNSFKKKLPNTLKEVNQI